MLHGAVGRATQTAGERDSNEGGQRGEGGGCEEEDEDDRVPAEVGSQQRRPADEDEGEDGAAGEAPEEGQQALESCF